MVASRLVHLANHVMRTTPASTPTAVALLIALALAACGEPPRRAPVGTQATAPTASGAAATATPAPTGDEAIRLAGVVQLAGPLANPPADAVLFVSVKPREGEFQRMPALTLRIELAGFAATEVVDGVRTIPFEVTGANTMAGGPPLAASALPSPFDVEALYDPTGGLRDPAQLVRTRVPVDGPRTDGLVVVLGAP
jgi:hypothetical protein